MLSVAILVSALMRPAPAPVLGTAAVGSRAAVSDAVTSEEVDRRIQAAVSASEARQGQRTEQLVQQIEDRGRRQLEALRLAAAQEVDYYQRNEHVLAASFSAPPREEGDRNESQVPGFCVSPGAGLGPVPTGGHRRSGAGRLEGAGRGETFALPAPAWTLSKRTSTTSWR